MVSSGIDQLDGFAAQRQAHAFGIENVGPADVGLQFRGRQGSIAVTVRGSEEVGRHAATSAVVGKRTDNLLKLEPSVAIAIQHVARHLRNAAIHISTHVLVGDEARSIRKYGAAFDVIPMAMAVDDIANRNLESLSELLFHPCRECRVDRIREDDSFRRDHEQREIVVVARAIDVAFDIDYLAGRSALLGDEGACDDRENQCSQNSSSHARKHIRG